MQLTNNKQVLSHPKSLNKVNYYWLSFQQFKLTQPTNVLLWNEFRLRTAKVLP